MANAKKADLISVYADLGSAEEYVNEVSDARSIYETYKLSTKVVRAHGCTATVHVVAVWYTPAHKDWTNGDAAGRAACEAYLAKRAADPNTPMQLGVAHEDSSVSYQEGFAHGWRNTEGK